MTPESMQRLYDYTYWAFDRVWDCILPLTEEQFTQELDYSIGSVRNHVVHMMSATQRWVCRLQGTETPPPPPYENYPTQAAVRAEWDVLKTETLAYIYSLDQVALDEPIHWAIATRNVSRTDRRWEILQHVANHATDHRAQILAMLHTHFGVKTVEQDLIFYIINET